MGDDRDTSPVGSCLEELLGITNLVSYQLPDPGEVVLLLQIVPSKGMKNACCWSAHSRE